MSQSDFMTLIFGSEFQYVENLIIDSLFEKYDLDSMFTKNEFIGIFKKLFNEFVNSGKIHSNVPLRLAHVLAFTIKHERNAFIAVIRCVEQTSFDLFSLDINELFCLIGYLSKYRMKYYYYYRYMDNSVRVTDQEYEAMCKRSILHRLRQIHNFDVNKFNLNNEMNEINPRYFECMQKINNHHNIKKANKLSE